jgi:hypothetical protein
VSTFFTCFWLPAYINIMRSPAALFTAAAVLASFSSAQLSTITQQASSPTATGDACGIVSTIIAQAVAASKLLAFNLTKLKWVDFHKHRQAKCQ